MRYFFFFFWQLFNKTTDGFNNIVFILLAKIGFKKVCEKMENNSTLKKVLLVWNRNAELLRLAGATVSEGWWRTILISLQKKSSQFFDLFVCCCCHLSCQISVESVRNIAMCSLNVLMTELYLEFFSIL